MNEYETQNPNRYSSYALRGLYFALLLVLVVLTLLSVGIYVLFSTYVYIPYLFGALFIGFLFIPVFLIYLMVLVHMIVTDIKKCFNRKRALSVPKDVVKEKNNYGGYILGTIFLGLIATFSAYLMFASVFDLYYSIFPKNVILYDAKISNRRNVGRKAILRKGQIIIGIDEDGNEYELFLGKGFNTIEYIPEIEVKYLPNTKIVKKYNVKK